MTARSVLSLYLLVICSGTAVSQTYYGTIRGTITDATGAITPGVKVTVTNIDTNISQDVESNSVGNYVAPNLIPGRYRVTAEPPGFKRFVVEDIELTATADRRVDVRLEVGQVTESVTVEGGAQLIETERATISDTKSNYVFTNMVINSNYRSIWRMLVLSPGVSGSTFAGNGQGRNTTYSIDGIPIKDGWTGSSFGPALTYLDSYREYRVDLVSVNASGGTSSNVAVVSESGTNQLHGEAWLHYNAIGFGARDFFAPARPHGPPIFRPNIKIGGPLYLGKLYNGRDRTFWHFSWQGLRGSQTPTVANFVVPTAAFRAGDFASLGTPIIDPSTGSAFPNNRIPESRISPVAKYYQDTFYPLPNSGTDRYNNVAVFPNTSDQYTARGDHKISNANSFFGRFMYQHYEFETWDGGANPNIGNYSQWRDQYHVVLSDTHVISPSMLNEFRVGYARDQSEYGGPNPGLPIVQAAGLQLADLQDVPGLPRMNITGFQPIYQGDMNGWMWSNFHVQETFHITRGKHNFRVGLEVGKYNGKQYATSPSAVFGIFGFNGRFSGDPYADFLLGLMDTSDRRTSVGPVYPHRLNWELFFTDDFKITPRFSLNYGLRYSLLDPGMIEQNLLANFVPAYNALVVPDEAARARVHPGFPASIPIVTANSVGLGAKLLNLDKNNFAPRVGFAWRPEFWNNFVIRGGAGVYYVAMQPYISDGGGAPYELRETFTNAISGGVPAFSFPRPFPGTAYVLGGTGASGMSPDFRTPYSTQYNVTMEKEAFDMGFSVSYMSTLSRKNVWSRNLNQPPADTRPYAEKLPLVPFPYLFSASYTENGGSHSYHAGVIKAERQFKKGLYYQAHLTLAKSMGDDWSTSGENAFDRRRDRSQGGTIPRWRAVAIALYELPFGRGKTFGSSMPAVLNHIVGNWNMGGTYVWQTGLYFTPAYAGLDASNTNQFGGRPDRVRDGNLSKSERSLERWFDTGAFVAPPAGAGRYGNSGAYILEGPGISVFHFGVNKDIVLHERAKLKLEMASTNFLNHPNFANPVNTIGTSTYGSILSTGGRASSSSGEGPRDFQFTARFIF
ncbi:MAG TPA: carboxypeptidase-like regulatory domain-containing protein [Bryobacteraceae bacterium]|nr:carboxypeptidase-like regulatory domain-containing protein [Bryobacteraceae bacterium]